jgi:hypothetical protein
MPVNTHSSSIGCAFYRLSEEPDLSRHTETLILELQLGIVIRTLLGILRGPSGKGQLPVCLRSQVSTSIARLLQLWFAAPWCSTERREHRTMPVRTSGCAREG